MSKYREIKDEIVAKRQATWDSVKDILESELNEINKEVFNGEWEFKADSDDSIGSFFVIKSKNIWNKRMLVISVSSKYILNIDIAYLVSLKGAEFKVQKSWICKSEEKEIQKTLLEVVRHIV